MIKAAQCDNVSPRAQREHSVIMQAALARQAAERPSGGRRQGAGARGQQDLGDQATADEGLAVHVGLGRLACSIFHRQKLSLQLQHPPLENERERA